MGTSLRILVGVVLTVFDLAVTFSVAGQSRSVILLPNPSSPPTSEPKTPLLAPIKYARITARKERGVDWAHLVKESLFFMSFENAFRCATEQGTRDGFSNPFVHGYLNSVGNLHGWSDGDPFLVNFVGHPMQGAVT